MDSKITVKDIVAYFEKFDLIIIQNSNSLKNEITSPRDIFSATKNNITFISNKLIDSSEEMLESNKASIVVISEDIYSKIKNNKYNFSLVISTNPKKEMISCLTHFFKPKNEIGFIHPSAIIEKGAEIGKEVSIGANSYVSSNSILEKGTILEENVVVKNATIGKNCILKSNSVIGNSGFGFQQDENGEQIEFPHFGRVLISDNVQVGSNTCIDRGALSDTIIEKGVKIDNLVHIAHNVQIGENSLIIANVLIGGSTKIGKNCWIAPSVTLKNGISIADNTLVGMGAVVTKNIEGIKVVAGSPAISLDDFKKWMAFRKGILKE